MKIIKINYKNPDPEAIKKVADAIEKGKIAIVPGDAVYTIVADAFNVEAIKKVYQMKKRERGKAFNLGLYCLDDIAKYGKSNSLIKKITKISKGIAYIGEEPVQLLFDGAKANDFVLVYGNLAMRKVNKSEAKGINEYGV